MTQTNLRAAWTNEGMHSGERANLALDSSSSSFIKNLQPHKILDEEVAYERVPLDMDRNLRHKAIPDALADERRNVTKDAFFSPGSDEINFSNKTKPHLLDFDQVSLSDPPPRAQLLRNQTPPGELYRIVATRATDPIEVVSGSSTSRPAAHLSSTRLALHSHRSETPSQL